MSRLDSVIVWRQGGSKATVYGVHGATAVVLLITAALLLSWAGGPRPGREYPERAPSHVMRTGGCPRGPGWPNRLP
jgi:hypothetical protein